MSKGLTIEEGELLLKKSVKLEIEAHDKFWDAMKRNPISRFNRSAGLFISYLYALSSVTFFQQVDTICELM